MLEESTFLIFPAPRQDVKWCEYEYAGTPLDGDTLCYVFGHSILCGVLGPQLSVNKGSSENSASLGILLRVLLTWRSYTGKFLCASHMAVLYRQVLMRV